MKSRLCLLGVCLLVPVAEAAWGQAATPLPDVGSIQVTNVNISAIDAVHVEVAVNLNLVPGQTATLKDIQLCSLHLNGLPVFAAPLHQEISLRKGEAIGLPPVFVSLFYRDLTTVHPLREMIEKQSVQVEGELVSGVQVGFLGKLALHSQHPQVVVPIDQKVAVEVGASAFERNLAVGVLSALETQMTQDNTAGKLLDGLRPAWIRDLEAKALPNLFVVQSSYSLTEDKTPYRVNSEALGFRVATGQIATSAEMLSPWKYDVEFLSELNGGSVKLVKNSTELRLDSLAGGGSALSFSNADFKVDPRGNAGPERVTTVGQKRSQVQLLRRASASSLAVLTPRDPITVTGLASAPASVQSQDAWDKVIVFRLRGKPGNGQRTVDALVMGARRDGDGIRLTEPVDEAVFGSPILTPDGVIGLVQDEQTGTFLPDDILRAPILPKGH